MHTCIYVCTIDGALSAVCEELSIIVDHLFDCRVDILATPLRRNKGLVEERTTVESILDAVFGYEDVLSRAALEDVRSWRGQRCTMSERRYVIFFLYFLFHVRNFGEESTFHSFIHPLILLPPIDVCHTFTRVQKVYSIASENLV